MKFVILLKRHANPPYIWEISAFGAKFRSYKDLMRWLREEIQSRLRS